MRKLINVSALLVLLVLAGCASYKKNKTDYYPDGKIKSFETEQTNGWDPKWSGGSGKTINMPFANPSVNGVGK